MTSLEDRLRAAMQEASRLAPDVNTSPLQLPERRGVRARPGRRIVTLAAPLAAAAAMAAVVAGVVAQHTEPTKTHRPFVGPMALRALPPYEVALTYVGQYKGWKIARTEAVAASTATGRRIATVRPPAPYNAFVAVTGSADGRTYILAAQHLARTQGRPFSSQPSTRLYQLQVRPDGATLTALRTPALNAMQFGEYGAMAVSPDGSQLAVTTPTNYGGQAAVRIYRVATGRLEHYWPVTPPPPPHKCCVFAPAATAPSWEANARYLALDVNLAHCLDCVMLLDTHAAGTSVQAVGRVVVRKDHLRFAPRWTNTLITPDGTTVLRSAAVYVPIAPHSNGVYTVPHVFGYSVSTGRQTSNVRGRRFDVWTIVWCSADGHSFVAEMHNQEGGWQFFPTVAIYRAGRWVRLQLPPQTVTIAW